MLVDPDMGRRTRPNWPNGLVGITPGSGQFMAGFGDLRDTLPAETGGWQGRAQHVAAGRAITLPSDVGRYFRTGLMASGVWKPENLRELHARVRSRSYFGSSISPRSFLQLRLDLVDGSKRLNGAAVDKLIELIAEMPVRVGKPAAEKKLSGCGPFLAHHVRQMTTRAHFRGQIPGWLVTPGRPLCILTLSNNCMAEMGLASYQRVPLKEGEDEVICYARRAGLDVWIVVGQSGLRRQRLELHFSRLHSERVVFENLARAMALGGGSAVTWKMESVQQAWGQCARYLSQKVAFGNNQQELLTALEGDLVMHAAQWDSLREAVSRMGPPVRRVVESVIQNIYGDQVLGDKGDKYENIDSSTIINRSAVQNALNNLTGDEDIDLSSALTKLAQEVERLNDRDASELTESLIAECAGRRRPKVIKSLWEALKQTAPMVGELSTTTAAMVKLTV